MALYKLTLVVGDLSEPALRCTRSFSKSETWVVMCATCQQLRGGSPFSVRCTTEVIGFLFSNRKDLSLSMYRSCFLSEASGICYIILNLFYFILFICFLFFLTPTSSMGVVMELLPAINHWQHAHIQQCPHVYIIVLFVIMNDCTFHDSLIFLSQQLTSYIYRYHCSGL